jgi:transcription elongation GreA/GreB family factor
MFSAAMTMDRKLHFIGELKRHYREIIAGAHRAEAAAAEAAESIRVEARRKEDAKAASLEARVASGHRKRREHAKQELESLIAFASKGLRPLGPDPPVGLGCLVDVSIEGEAGTEERTLFVLPVGAGTELDGPGGDGFLSVITPASPVGRGLHGMRAGDSFEIVVEGKGREWTVVDVC